MYRWMGMWRLSTVRCADSVFQQRAVHRLAK
jgi:hypothetical protein